MEVYRLFAMVACGVCLYMAWGYVGLVAYLAGVLIGLPIE